MFHLLLPLGERKLSLSPAGWGLRSSHCRAEETSPRRALARDGVSREVPCSALKGETVPDSLPATPKSPPLKGHQKPRG